MLLTGTPRNVVGLDLGKHGGGLVLAADILNAVDEHVELAWQAATELLNGGNLLLLADDAGDGPRAAEEQRGQLLGDFAVAAEDEDVVRSRHAFGYSYSSLA